MITSLAILAGLLLVLSVLSFLLSVSKKVMSLLYLALVLFGCCVLLSAYTIYLFVGQHV